MNSPRQRFHPSAGIAIGPILFVIAMLAVLAAVMASGNGDYQVASGADRITADISAQANLIRSTINDCNMRYSLAVSTNPNALASDPYPDTPASGLVADLECSPLGAVSIWNNGASNILLPPPTKGFNPWSYVNAGVSGGRCFWTTPSAANPKSSSAIVGGLTHAASRFNSAAAASLSKEVIYDPASDSQKFVVWVTMPSDLSSIDALCEP